MSSLELKLLGGFNARLSSGEALTLPSRKGQILLALLALRAGEALAREKLIGLLWGDRSDSNARGSLRQELTILRKVLSMVEPQPLRIDAERLQLEASAVEVDVLEFEKLARSESAIDLERAVTIYSGPFLGELMVKDSVCAEWLFHERERLRSLVLGALERLLALRIREGALEQATTLAETILSHDPLREDVHRRLMELHARLGRFGSALKQYQTCRSILAKELSVEPEPATTRLFEEIRARRAESERSRGGAGGSSAGAGALTAGRRGRAEGNLNAAGLATSTSKSEEAAQLYQMGRSFFLRNIWGKRALVAARQLFSQAIDLDPYYARAYAGLSNCDCYQLLLGAKGVSLEEIEANSSRALDLDPDSPEALAAKGLALYVASEHARAIPFFERAIARGPELFEAHYFFARNCRALGQHRRAAQLFERAAALNKNDYRALGLLADEYRSIGRLGDSLAAARACLERVNVEVAAQPDDWHALSFGATVLAELGEWGRAEEWVERARRVKPDDPIVNYNLACAYAQLGRSEPAIEQLNATFSAPEINQRAFFEWMREDSALDPIRSHPDFHSLVARLEARIATADDGHRTTALEATDRRVAIAVLPFTNIGDDESKDFLADGLTEDIITDLTRAAALSVISRAAVEQYKGRALDLRDVARALSVRFVLEGGVRLTGDQMNVTVKLVDAINGSSVWAERYTENFDGSQRPQHDISQAIAANVIANLLPDEVAAPDQDHSRNPEAHRQFLVGRSYFLMKGGGIASLRVARQAFEKAVQIDPLYARAHAGIASTDCLRIWRGEADLWTGEILASGSRAVQLGPRLPEAHTALGLALHAVGRHTEAAAALAEAVRLGPGLFEAQYFAGRNLRAMGRFAEAAAHFERAGEIEPDLYRALGLAVGCYSRIGRYDQMASAARRCIERCSAEIAVHPANVDTIAFGAAVLAVAGETGKAHEWIGQAQSLQSNDPVVNYNLAAAFAALGEADNSIKRLARLLDLPLASRRLHFNWLRHDVAFDSIRGHADFVELTQSLERQTAQQEERQNRHPIIAVLPFVDNRDEQSRDFLADGLTEEIISDLSRVSSLSVVSRRALGAYKGKGMSAREIARSLSVSYVLEGAVGVSEGDLSVTVQALDGYTGEYVWTDRYDRKFDDLLKTQHELSQDIVKAVVDRLLPQETLTPAKPQTTNPEAYRHYLVGRSYFLLRGGGIPGLRIARQAFEKALQIDPEYAQALAGIANTDSLRLWRGDTSVSVEEILKRSQRAVELDPDAPDAHVAKGLALYLVGRHTEAVTSLSEAARLGPSLFEAHYFAGRSCRVLGRHLEAAEHFERAGDLEPDHYRALGLAVGAYGHLGRKAEMHSAARRAIERCRSEIAVHPGNVDACAFGAAVAAEAGEVEVARELIAKTEALQPTDSVANYNLAAAYAALGEAEPAVQKLMRVHADPYFARRVHVDWLAQDRSFDPIRDHPQFIELKERLESVAQQGPLEPGDASPEVLETSATHVSGDSEARRLYLLGRSYFRQRGGAAAVRVAREAFARAVAADSNFSQALAGQAACDAYLLCRGDPKVSLEGVLTACERALQLHPTLAEAYAAKGLAYYAVGRLAESSAALEEAVRLGPDLYEAHFFAGRCLRAQGRLEMAAAHFERAAELQPTCFRSLGLAAGIYRSLGWHDKELSAARRGLDRCEAEISVDPDNADALAKGGAMLVELGDAAQAREWIERAEGADPNDMVTTYSLAYAYSLLGDFDRVISRLERVFSGPPSAHKVHLHWLKHERSFDPIRGHAKFVELMQRVENTANRLAPSQGSRDDSDWGLQICNRP